MEGWICLHRILLSKPIWKQSTPSHKSVLIAVLLMANHEPNEWEWMGETFKTKPGEFVTSLASIKKKCGNGVSIQQIRRALVRFQKLDFCTMKSTKAGRLISICNWSQYQEELRQDRQRNRQSTDKEPTPNNNETMKQINTLSIQLYEFYNSEIQPARKTRQRALSNIEKYLNREPYEKLESAILNYKTTLNGTAPKFRKDPANFFGINEPYATDFYPETFRAPEKPKGATPDWF